MTQPEREIQLRHGSHRAWVSNFGASLRRFFVVDESGRERDILWGYQGAAAKKGGQGDVLMPFPGRVRGGAYRFNGGHHQMKLNDKDGPNAIHGFARSLLWKEEEVTASSAAFSLLLEGRNHQELGYPFAIQMRVRYSLSDEGLRCDFEIQNLGDHDAPVGAGFHPYFTAGALSVNEAEALIPARELIRFGPDLLPTGEVVGVEGSGLDFRHWRAIGEARLLHCFRSLERDESGIARAGLRDPRTGRKVSVWVDRAFDYLVVYTGDAIPSPYARQSLAIEPMTCGTDAFNHPEWGLAVLKPGELLKGSWGVL